MKVGKSIQEIRKSKGLSQEQFANMFHVTRQTVSNWENEKSYPDLQTLIAISEQFDVSLDKLMKEDPQMAEEIDKDRKKVKIFRLVLVSLLPFLIGGIHSYYCVASRLPYLSDVEMVLRIMGLIVWGYACYKVATPERKVWLQIGLLNLPGMIEYIRIIYEEYAGIEETVLNWQNFIIRCFYSYFDPAVAMVGQPQKALVDWSFANQSFTYMDFYFDYYIVIIYTVAWIIMLTISIIAVLIKTRKSKEKERK